MWLVFRHFFCSRHWWCVQAICKFDVTDGGRLHLRPQLVLCCTIHLLSVTLMLDFPAFWFNFSGGHFADLAHNKLGLIFPIISIDVHVQMALNGDWWIQKLSTKRHPSSGKSWIRLCKGTKEHMTTLSPRIRLLISGFAPHSKVRVFSEPTWDT